MKFLKTAVRKVIHAVSPDWESRAVDQFRFNRLRRRPPELMWQALAPGPAERLDAAGAKVGREILVFGGFLRTGEVLPFVDIFDLQRRTWTARIKAPVEVPQTHIGMDSDERYVYLVSGQVGRFCRPAVPDCFVFDTVRRSFDRLPPLPRARYAPAVQLWRGRLHAVGGSQEDRNAPSTDHWSLAVKGGKALENSWRAEPPIPRGGPHRAAAVIRDNLYVFGGQEGDYIAIPGDPEFRCTGDLTCETMYADTYCLEAGASSWKKMADMPVPASHTEYTIVAHGDCIALLGGQMAKDPKTKIITLTDAVQVYNAATDTWTVAGRLPYCVKSPVAAYDNGVLYMTTGQRGRSPADPTPVGNFERGMWGAPFQFP
jgi:hypothetical protein